MESTLAAFSLSAMLLMAASEPNIIAVMGKRMDEITYSSWVMTGESKFSRSLQQLMKLNLKLQENNVNSSLDNYI